MVVVPFALIDFPLIVTVDGIKGWKSPPPPHGLIHMFHENQISKKWLIHMFHENQISKNELVHIFHENWISKMG